MKILLVVSQNLLNALQQLKNNVQLMIWLKLICKLSYKMVQSQLTLAIASTQWNWILGTIWIKKCWLSAEHNKKR